MGEWIKATGGLGAGMFYRVIEDRLFVRKHAPCGIVVEGSVSAELIERETGYDIEDDLDQYEMEFAVSCAIQSPEEFMPTEQKPEYAVADSVNGIYETFDSREAAEKMIDEWVSEHLDEDVEYLTDSFESHGGIGISTDDDREYYRRIADGEDVASVAEDHIRDFFFIMMRINEHDDWTEV